MKDLVLEIMEQSEDVDFILSRDTAYEAALALLDDGRAFEEMEEFEIIEEINNSVAVIVSQVLTGEGYIYILENYLFDNGTAKGIDGADLVIIEDKIEDLVDIDKVYLDVVMTINDNSEENVFVSALKLDTEKDMAIDTYCIKDGDCIVIELAKRLPTQSVANIRKSIKETFPNNEVLIYCKDDFSFKIINKIN